jgi:hypothetical protein
MSNDEAAFTCKVEGERRKWHSERKKETKKN